MRFINRDQWRVLVLATFQPPGTNTTVDCYGSYENDHSSASHLNLSMDYLITLLGPIDKAWTQQNRFHLKKGGRFQSCFN